MNVNCINTVMPACVRKFGAFWKVVAYPSQYY